MFLATSEEHPLVAQPVLGVLDEPGDEFHVYCEGDDAPVTEVERQWIH